MKRRLIVGVMGPGDTNSFTSRVARNLGRLIAEQGWIVLSGGRDVGVMEAVNEGAKGVEGSITVGILPTVNSRPSSFIDIPVFTDMHSARNNINVLSSDIVVACGEGGAGTASEIALAIKASKMVILLGESDEAICFFKKLGRNLVHTADTPEGVIEKIKSLC